MYRINCLLISQSNLQASETERCCKSVCSTYAALSSSVCYSILNHLIYNLLTIISYRFVVSKIFFFFNLKITGFHFKNAWFKVYSQQNQNTMELNVGVYSHVVSTKLCSSENVLDLEIPETPVVVFLCPKVIIYLPQSLRF